MAWFSREWGNRESGQASMVTVTMFMMLFAIVSVSFTYIVVSTTRQATNDSLQSTAKAAAESGVEDAKRLLMYCLNNQNGDGSFNLSGDKLAMCQNVVGRTIDETGCQDVLKYAGSVGFSVESDNGNYSVPVGGTDSDSNPEYYQCLKIATMTPTYQGIANTDGESVVVPMKLVDRNGNPADAAQVEINWHRNIVGEYGDQLARGISSGSSIPRQSVWNSSSTNQPAILRVEQVFAPKTGNITLGTLIANDSAITLRPSTGGSTSGNITAYHPKYNNTDGNDDQPNDTTTPIVEVRCYNYADNHADYACKYTLTGGMATASNDYFLRINTIYKGTHFLIAAKDASGNPLYFDGVQPIVDVTGRSADSFARIQAQLQSSVEDDAAKWWPEYAIETEGRVCKDISVYYDSGSDGCN